MTKDTFQILADEITLIRKDIERLQRTSLNKDEAKNLNEVLVKSLDRMSGTGDFVLEESAKILDGRLATFGVDIAGLAQNLRIVIVNVAAEASEKAVQTINRESISATKDLLKTIQATHQETIASARDLTRSAREAHREALRYFGGFWVWISCVGSVGCLLGALAAFWMTGRDDARAFGAYPSLYCRDAGGDRRELETQDATYEVCVFWGDKIKGKPKQE